LLNSSTARPIALASQDPRTKAFAAIWAADMIGSVRAALPVNSFQNFCGGSNMPTKKPSRKAAKGKTLKVKKLSKTQPLTGSHSAGAGAGKVTFNPF
jgi:hypothetical protein